jgi:ferredoxin--NADP+ reductase
MNRILSKKLLSTKVTRLDIHSPRIAQIRKPGQFVIVHLGEGSERIPLTVADSDPVCGYITLVIQAVGKSTKELVALREGDFIENVAGPLGHPTEMIDSGHALCIGGGVGTAVVHPIAKGLSQLGVRVTSVIGGRSREGVIFERELEKCGNTYVCTDDGSHGLRGFVTDLAGRILTSEKVDIVYAVGPVPMMRAVSNLTREFGVRTIVSLNPVMIDGTGMCGGCRVSLGSDIKFACVDGPEFDGHQVDFDELQDRLSTYVEFEQRSLACAEGNCRLEETSSAAA